MAKIWAFALLVINLLHLCLALPVEKDENLLISLIKSGSKTVVDTRTDQSRMVDGFIPGSIRAGEFGQEGPSDLDISSVVFLVDQPKVEEEICSEEVSCYTGSLAPFKDDLIFPEEVNFAALTELLDRNEVVLIDVRRPEELVNDGEIPGSVNVPLQEIPGAFKLSSQDFNAKYGFELPDKGAKNVVLTCRSGRRILVAQERMASLGYTSLRLYRSANIFGFCLAKLKVTNSIIINFLQGQHQRLEGK